MTLNDIPGKVTLPRQWPLGLILGLLGVVLWFSFDTRASIADLARRESETREKVAQLEREAKTVAPDLAAIKVKIDALYELIRDERRRNDRRTPE